ncbi:MAG: dephospho-CoA kinase [Pseudomonadota bacterium]
MRAYCLGLTGGIGSGKSTVATLFAGLGAAVVDTDEIARELTAPGGAAMPAIVAAFGADARDAQGALDRARMRGLVFSDPEARRRLESILHPLIRAEAAGRLARAGPPYVVLVVPLLAERLDDYRGIVDRVAVVDCDPAQQLARIAARPGLDEAQARAILAAQAAPAARLAIADDVIDNRGDLAALRAQVVSLHARCLRAAGIKSPA